MKSLFVSLLLQAAVIYGCLAGDLKMLSLKPKFPPVVGGKVVVTASMENQAINWISVPITFLLSNDANVDSQDITLKEEMKYFANSEVSNREYQIELPIESNNGDYILAVCDLKNSVVESDEMNNVSNFRLENLTKGIIDVEVMGILSNRFLQNESVQVTSRLRNNGNTYLDSEIMITYYLSKDIALDAKDTVLDEEMLQYRLGPGEIYTYYSFLFNVKIPAGKYYVITKIGQNNTEDMNPTNDFKVDEIVVAAKDVDLTPKIESRYSIMSPGDTVIFYFSSNSIGSTYKLNSDTLLFTYFFSSDTLLDNSDEILGTYRTFQGSFNKDLRMPQLPVASGLYLLLKVKLLPFDGVNESNIANNVCYYKLNLISPIVDITTESSPYSYLFDVIGVNPLKQVAFPLSNDGNVTARNILVSLYLSQDKSLDGSDRKIKDTTIAILYKQREGWVSFDLRGETFTMGNNFLITQVDPANAIKEYSETNNIGYKEFIKTYPALDFDYENVRIDEVSNRYHSERTYSKLVKNITDTLALTAYIMNQVHDKSMNVGSLEIGVYFSEDTILDLGKDILLKMFSKTETNSVNEKFSIEKIDQPKGYLLVMIDPNRKYSEYTINNNLSVFDIEVRGVNSIIANFSKAQTVVFPNPCNDKLFFSETVRSFELFDECGKWIYSGSHEKLYDASKLSSGNYFLKIKDEDGFYNNLRFLKE